MVNTTVDFLNKVESTYFSGVYQVQTSDKQIRSEISYVKEDGVIILAFNSPKRYESVYKVKSHEKAIIILKRAEKAFKKANKSNSALTLGSMQEDYKNYFIEALEDYTAPWNK